MKAVAKTTQRLQRDFGKFHFFAMFVPDNPAIFQQFSVWLSLCSFSLRGREEWSRRRTDMKLHKTYILLGLIIAFVLFLGIAARADEPASHPKSGMLLTRDQPATPLFSLAAGRDGNGTTH